MPGWTSCAYIWATRAHKTVRIARYADEVVLSRISHKPTRAFANAGIFKVVLIDTV